MSEHAACHVHRPDHRHSIDTARILGAGLVLGAFLSRMLAELPWVPWPFYRWGLTAVFTLAISAGLLALERRSASAPYLVFYVLLTYVLQPAPNPLQAGVLLAGTLSLFLLLRVPRLRPHSDRLIALLLFAVAMAIKEGRAQRGVLVCGTGIGISIAANRYPEVRAALVHDAFGARMARRHNDANVICFGGRAIGIEVARDCLKIFLDTEFEDGGRHVRRVAKLSAPD